jgi:uncharacterized membrane protein HdeD (DUF308 family)
MRKALAMAIACLFRPHLAAAVVLAFLGQALCRTGMALGAAAIWLVDEE